MPSTSTAWTSSLSNWPFDRAQGKHTGTTYVHDGLGSVRQLLDNTGQIATKYAYDPFGVPLASDTVPNPWQFTGEAWDAEVELLYLRAR